MTLLHIVIITVTVAVTEKKGCYCLVAMQFILLIRGFRSFMLSKLELGGRLVLICKGMSKLTIGLALYNKLIILQFTDHLLVLR